MTHHHSKRFLSSQSLDCEVQKQSFGFGGFFLDSVNIVLTLQLFYG